MSDLRSILSGVIVCAVIVGLAERATPKGSVRGTVRLCGGLLMILTLLRPFAGGFRPAGEAFAPDLPSWEEQKEIYAEEYDRALRRSIAERTEAYIEDKAAELGVTVRASVSVTDGLPSGAILYGAENEALSELIERELGIARTAQEWREAK